MDLVDEEHVVRLEIGEQRGEIARARDHGPAGGAKAHAELARHDLRQRGLAEPGRTEEQHMVQGLAAGVGGRDEHAQVFPRRLLPDEFSERFWPQRRVRVLGLAGRGVKRNGFAHTSISSNSPI